MIFKKTLTGFALVCLLVFSGGVSAWSQAPVDSGDQADLTVAVFSRNKTTHSEYEKYADMLRSGLTAKLSDKFVVIDKDDVVNTFEKEKVQESTRAVDLWSYLQMLSEVEQGAKAADREANVDKRTAEEKSSALRIAQSIGAKYFLIADVEEIVSNNIQDAVYGQQINDLRITADVAVKILDGIKGGTILAENVRTEKRLRGDENTSFSTADIAQALPALMKQASSEVAQKFLSNIDKVRSFKSDAVQVKFKIKTNVKDAVVELDGVGIGSAPGDFQALGGVHRLRVTKDGYRAFERDVNITAKAEFSVSLEETSEARDAQLKKEKADADNYATKKKADAEYKHGPNKSVDW
jgi:hypothetical protein